MLALPAVQKQDGKNTFTKLCTTQPRCRLGAELHHKRLTNQDGNKSTVGEERVLTAAVQPPVAATSNTWWDENDDEINEVPTNKETRLKNSANTYRYSTTRKQQRRTKKKKRTNQKENVQGKRGSNHDFGNTKKV